jgi:hypothetical protein
MVEVNRRLYLNEQSGASGPDFDRCRTALSEVIHGLLRQTPLA